MLSQVLSRRRVLSLSLCCHGAVTVLGCNGSGVVTAALSQRCHSRSTQFKSLWSPPPLSPPTPSPEQRQPTVQEAMP
eukprot:2435510-Rhodomonas_salina.1